MELLIIRFLKTLRTVIITIIITTTIKYISNKLFIHNLLKMYVLIEDSGPYGYLLYPFLETQIR